MDEQIKRELDRSAQTAALMDSAQVLSIIPTGVAISDNNANVSFSTFNTRSSRVPDFAAGLPVDHIDNGVFRNASERPSKIGGMKWLLRGRLMGGKSTVSELRVRDREDVDDTY